MRVHVTFLSKSATRQQPTQNTWHEWPFCNWSLIQCNICAHINEPWTYAVLMIKKEKDTWWTAYAVSCKLVPLSVPTKTGTGRFYFHMLVLYCTTLYNTVQHWHKHNMGLLCLHFMVGSLLLKGPFLFLNQSQWNFLIRCNLNNWLLK